MGTMFSVDGYRLDTMTIPYDYSNLRFWRNTDIADLEPGETHRLSRTCLATNGIPTSKTASGRTASSTCRCRPSR